MTGDHGRITARSWPRDATTGSAELIDEFAQVARFMWMTYSAPTG
jgi:hypothetical protein